MQRETKTRVGIAALIYTMTNAVLFGAGLITVLLLPGFSSELMIWIPVVVVASIILAAPVAWLIAPRLRARYWRERETRHPLAERSPLAPGPNRCLAA
jgi:multidrug efflux pump subunit AcrB